MTQIEVRDEDIAEALRLFGYDGTVAQVRVVRTGQYSMFFDSADVLVLAQTIAKLRVAVEALEVIQREGLQNHGTRCVPWWQNLRQALAQIKGTNHD